MRPAEDALAMSREPVISGLAQNTAAALDAARRENERLRQRAELLEGQVRGLLALQALTTTVSADLALAPLPRRIAAAALRMTGAQGSALYLLDDTRQTLIAYALETAQSAADSGIFLITNGQHDEAPTASESLPRVPIESGLAGWVASNGSFALVGDVTRDPRFAPELFDTDAQVLGIAPVALLAVPLVKGDEVTGVLEVGYGPNTPGPDATSLDLVQTLASAAAAAMANVGLYRQLRDTRDGYVATQEGERRRLARELHDGPAQQVGQLALALEYAEQLARHDPRQVPGELRRLREQTVGIAGDLRRLRLALRPLILDVEPGGLVPALERYLERFNGAPEPRMQLSAEYPDRLPSEVEAAVFVVAQEAVANVLQHAHAGNCWVEVSETPERLVMTVRDDGAGFDAKQVQQEYETRGGLGLVNMLERAANVGGKLTVASQPGRGTVTSLDVPRATP